MLPIILVLFVATSTLAAPGVLLKAVSINDVVHPKHNGGIISADLTNQASEIYDGGVTPAYVITTQRIVDDLADQRSKNSQALALAETIAILGSLGTGIPGDACEVAELINAYVKYIRSGNKAGIRSAVIKFIKSLSASIDTIVQLATNPSAQRFVTGPRGNCHDGGRTYQFEEAWDLILANASPSSAGLVNEQYCAAKRLYHAFDSRSNNVGAFITAASLPAVNNVFVETLVPVAKFLTAVVNGNPHSAAAVAKSAMAKAAQNC